jgi:hypothetical protein
MVTRRSVLRSGGVLLSGLLAGCQSSGSTSDGTSTTSLSTTQATTTLLSTTTPEPQLLSVGESATVDDGSVTVTAVRAERSIVVLDGYHTEVVTEANAQYLVVSLTTEDPIDGDYAARNAIELEVAGERYPVAEHAFPPADDGAFDLGVRLPLAIEASEAHIGWNGTGGERIATWEIPDAVMQRLNDPPAFEVVSFDVPETVAPFEPFDATVAVENTGEGDGTFVAELGLASRSDQATFRMDVPAGERVTDTEDEQVAGEAGETDTLLLDWGLGRLERTIEITEETTTDA